MKEFIDQSTEHTILLVQPYLVEMGLADEIRIFVSKNGLQAEGVFRVIMNEEMATSFLRDMTGTVPPKPMVNAIMGTSLVYIFSGLESAKMLRKLVGPKNSAGTKIGTLRHMYGIDDAHNGFWAPHNVETAMKAIEHLKFIAMAVEASIQDKLADPFERAGEMVKLYFEKGEEADVEEDTGGDDAADDAPEPPGVGGSESADRDEGAGGDSGGHADVPDPDRE